MFASILRLRLCCALAAMLACGCGGSDSRTSLTFSGSALGPEAEVINRQLARFAGAASGRRRRPARHAGRRRSASSAVRPVAQRARAEPDVLQLDVIWTAEFAGAGWILPLDAVAGDADGLRPRGAWRAARWRDTLYAVPWFVDVGLLYWRTDLLDRAAAIAGRAARRRASRLRHAGRRGSGWSGRARATKGSSRCSSNTSRRSAAASSTPRARHRGRACGDPRADVHARRARRRRVRAAHRCSRGRKSRCASRSRTATRSSCATGRTRGRCCRTRAQSRGGRPVRRRTVSRGRGRTARPRRSAAPQLAVNALERHPDTRARRSSRF